MSTLSSVKFKLHDEYLKLNPKIGLYKSKILQVQRQKLFEVQQGNL